MSLLPTFQDIEIAAELLVKKYRLTTRSLGKLMSTKTREQAQKVYSMVADSNLSLLELTKIYINNRGSMLFAGSNKNIREWRKNLLKSIDDEMIIKLYHKHFKDGTLQSPGHMRTALANRKWHSGNEWAKDFVSHLGFPEVFAGIRAEKKPENIIEILPRLKLPDLKEYQLQLKNRMKEVLEQQGNRTRCIVTLPTGGGKTRIAVEAFVEWMQPRFSKQEYLVWIAQSQELCEQAITSIRQVWSNTTYVESLRVYRYFGDREISLDDLKGGVIVASIHKLYHRINSGDEVVDVVLANTGAMIIDEAHGAVTEMYRTLFNRARQLKGEEMFSVCGLTATPGRSNENTRMLVDEFEANLIKPQLPARYDANPLQYFREKGYLAYAYHQVVHNEKTYEFDESELDAFLQEDEIDYENSRQAFLKVLAADADRNKLIINTLLRIPTGNQVLVYACTVKHSELLASLMNSLGRRSVSVSSNTPDAIRRMIIDEFRNGEIDFIFNYGVLTTGFDAPKTSYIVICRPTSSVILYEQIIGRGLRGPQFGGTKECTIIDFADNIFKHGKPLAYKRFSENWPDFWSKYDTDPLSGFHEAASTRE